MIGETTVLITGKRGNGKSLKAVDLMFEEVSAGRAVFASNFNDLNVPGVQTLDDPRKWEDLPAGSILFVDEAQKFWRSRRSGDPPPEVQAMETQRHSGITIVLLTQQPTYLDKHIRGLVDRHHHLMLEVGGKASRMWTWTRCMDDCEEANVRAEGDMSIFVFPTKRFGAYRSAEVHTIKAKIPRKWFVVAAGATVCVGLMLFGMHKGKAAGMGHEERAQESGVSAEGDTTDSASPGKHKRPLYTTAAEYQEVMRPRVQAAPWTAPAFDGRQVVSEPRVFCMASQNGEDGTGRESDGGCHCKTEQGTDYATDPQVCLAMARHGESYNPFRRPDRDTRKQERGEESRTENAGSVSLAARDNGDAAHLDNVVQPHGGFGRDLVPFPATSQR